MGATTGIGTTTGTSSCPATALARPHREVRMLLGVHALRQIRLYGIQETGRVLELSLPCPASEAPQCPFRQFWPTLGRESRYPATALAHRVFRHVGGDSAFVPATVHVPSGVGPRVVRIQPCIPTTVVAPRVRQSTTDPLRHRHRHCIPEQPPPMPGRLRAQHRRPAFGKSLKPFHGLDRRRRNPTGRQQHGRRTRDSQSRTGLQRRDGVGRQAVACTSLRPIESYWACQIEDRPFPVPGIVGEQHVTRVGRPARHDEHATAALSKAEPPAVHNPIGPLVAALFESLQDVLHSRSVPEMQHEIDVFDNDPGHGTMVEQLEQLADDRALPASDSFLVAGHGQVLAGEAGPDDLCTFRKLSEGCSVRLQANARPSSSKDLRRAFIALAQQDRTMPRSLESQLEAADPGEQTCNHHDVELPPPRQRTRNPMMRGPRR